MRDASWETPALLRVFSDLDTPVTLNRIRAGQNAAYIGPQKLVSFDLVLSYSGGKIEDISPPHWDEWVRQPVERAGFTAPTLVKRNSGKIAVAVTMEIQIHSVFKTYPNGGHALKYVSLPYGTKSGGPRPSLSVSHSSHTGACGKPRFMS